MSPGPRVHVVMGVFPHVTGPFFSDKKNAPSWHSSSVELSPGQSVRGSAGIDIGANEMRLTVFLLVGLVWLSRPICIVIGLSRNWALTR